MEKSKHQDYLGTEYSSGDSKMIKSKQKFTEENNNELDELTQDFSEMGCIVNPDKRPSNICIENCVYEGSSEDEEPHNGEADIYSDEFEDDKSEEEELKLESVSLESPRCNDDTAHNVSQVNSTKSTASMSSKATPIASGRSTSSSQYVRRTRRVNMSFTNDRLREIERHNHILLNKILSARNRKSSIPAPDPPRRPAPPAAIQRKQAQKKIDHENMILLKKIQRAAPAPAHGARR